MSSEEIRPARYEVKTPARRKVLKIAYGLAGAGVSALLVDMGSSVRMSGYTDVDVEISDGNTLTVCAPGVNADIHTQAAPILPEMRSHGDVVYVQPMGRDYSLDRISIDTAEEVTGLLRRRQYARVVFTSISMGVFSQVRAANLMNDIGIFEDTSTVPSFTMIDTPSSIDDIPRSKHKLLQLSRYPAGDITRGLIKVGGMVIPSADLTVDPLLLIDQVRTITKAQPPAPDSLGYLNSLVYWRSDQGDDVVNGSSARAVWLKAAGDDVRTATIEVDMPHAGLEANPEEARRAIVEAYNFHLV